MRIGQKFVVEHFIFVVTFAQIWEKQAHDEFRSQFAFFATQRTSVIPYGQNRNKTHEKQFGHCLTVYHKQFQKYRRKQTFVLLSFYPAVGRYSVTSTTISNNSILKRSISSRFSSTSFIICLNFWHPIRYNTSIIGVNIHCYEFFRMSHEL